MKVEIQWNEKDFQQSLKSRSDCPFFNDLFWKFQFNENEKNFQLSFWLCFHIFFLKVALQQKWKGLSTVTLTLFSQPKPGWPFCRSFLRVAIQWKWKRLSTVTLTLLHRTFEVFVPTNPIGGRLELLSEFSFSKSF